MRKNLKNIWKLRACDDGKLTLLEFERPWSGLWVRASLARFNYDTFIRVLDAKAPDYRATLYYFFMREFAFARERPLPAIDFYKAPDYEVAMYCFCKEKLPKRNDPFFMRGQRIYFDEISPSIKGKWTAFKAFTAIVKYFDKSYRR